ncbi:MAG: hypothetical protein ACOCXN_11010 [Spirochaetota bacterium]
MSPFEVLAAFLVVMGVVSIPIIALINRSKSPIGQAIADRIRSKTAAQYGRLPASPASTSPNPPSAAPENDADPLAVIERQQEHLREMGTRLEFLERLIEKQQSE